METRATEGKWWLICNKKTVVLCTVGTKHTQDALFNWARMASTMTIWTLFVTIWLLYAFTWTEYGTIAGQKILDTVWLYVALYSSMWVLCGYVGKAWHINWALYIGN